MRTPLQVCRNAWQWLIAHTTPYKDCDAERRGLTARCQMVEMEYEGFKAKYEAWQPIIDRVATTLAQPVVRRYVGDDQRRIVITTMVDLDFLYHSFAAGRDDAAIDCLADRYAHRIAHELKHLNNSRVYRGGQDEGTY